ncbi:MAG: acyl-CoA thioesterase, partial [Opitutales bacterium]
VTILTTLKEKPLLRIRLDYEVRRGEELLVTGFTVHGFISKQGAPVRPPALFTDKMRELFAISPS